MSLRHTPGRWETEEEEQGENCLLAVYVRHAESGGRIGKVFANCLVNSDEELRANFRAFAAAPELLAMLREIVVKDRAAIAELAALHVDLPRSSRELPDRAAALLDRIDGAPK